MFSALKNTVVNNQDVLIRRGVGLASIVAGMAINTMLNQPKTPKNVVVVEEATVIVEERTEPEAPAEESK
ncbi:hypothetical protein SEA_TRUCKEE_40 [Arthrobacter phage Truckee]|nr:hypothetical protein SEA_TRUCKEE_40 [Arthrobacter phage Truckee]